MLLVLLLTPLLFLLSVIDLGRVADILDPPEHRFYGDPVAWITQYTFIWSKQREVCEAVRDNRFVAVRACHGPGKSFIAGWIACWWLATREDALVVTSAPSSNQVANILWKEIRRAKELAGLKGFITQGDVPQWKLGGETIAFGRKPPDYVDPEKASTVFQGHHATHILVILDESSGIPNWLATAAEAMATNENSRVLMIGNPTDPKSYFAKVQKPNGGYHTIKISVWDMPWNTGEEVPIEVAEKLTGRTWVEERRARWGQKSILWQARVEAEFPTVTEDTLFTPGILAKGISADRKRFAREDLGTCGWDLGRYGVDESVVVHCINGYTRVKAAWGRSDLETSIDNFLELWPQALEIPMVVPPTTIDTTGGLGAGPYDNLRKRGYAVIDFDAGSGAFNKTRYKNRRAEAYWEAMEAMNSGIVDIDEEDEALIEELLEIKWKPTSTGLVQIEDKDEIKKRLGRSPDRADAFVMALQDRGDWIKALGLSTTPESQPRDLVEDDPQELVKDVMDVQL